MSTHSESTLGGVQDALEDLIAARPSLGFTVGQAARYAALCADETRLLQQERAGVRMPALRWLAAAEP